MPSSFHQTSVVGDLAVTTTKVIRACAAGFTRFQLTVDGSQVAAVVLPRNHAAVGVVLLAELSIIPRDTTIGVVLIVNVVGVVNVVDVIRVVNVVDVVLIVDVVDVVDIVLVVGVVVAPT